MDESQAVSETAENEPTVTMMDPNLIQQQQGQTVDNGEVYEQYDANAMMQAVDPSGMDSATVCYIDAPQMSPLRDQDRFLPIANVSKIMKKAITNKNGKIAKETKERVQECLSEFVSFITSEAADKCHQEKRKTINGDDLIYAMKVLGFDNYIEPLSTFLVKYREMNKLEIPTTEGQEMVQGGSYAMGMDEMETKTSIFAGAMSSAPAGPEEGSSYIPVYTNGNGNPSAVSIIIKTANSTDYVGESHAPGQ